MSLNLSKKTLTYGATQRLKRKKDIEYVIAHGKSIRSGALRLRYAPGCEGNKMGVTVPKRWVRKAVDRNAIKRLIRESYRLQQEQWPNIEGKPLYGMLIYQSNQPASFDYIDRKMHQLRKALIKRLSTSEVKEE